MPPRILLADADAFFVAVARREDPEGAGKASLLIVGGRPGSRGVVCSASYEARAFGVRSGMGISQALRLCPDAMAVPVPRRACSDASHAIAKVLDRFAPHVAAASIDEFYLDLTGTEAMYGHEPLDHTAARIRRTVLDETGYALSIGGGTSRLVAKIAAGAAKPTLSQGRGVCIVPAGDEELFMRTQPLAEIPGIGPKAQVRLATFGLVRVPDVLDADQAVLRRFLGDKLTNWLLVKCRGVGDADVETRERQKGMSREDTFDHDLVDDIAIDRELQRLVVRVVGDLRGDGLRARTVSIKLRDSDFTTRGASRTLREGVCTERPVLAVARALLSKLRAQRRVPVRLIGVSLSHLDDSEVAEQLALLPEVVHTEATETPRDRALAAAVDKVRARFGRTAVHPASLLDERTARATVEDRDALVVSERAARSAGRSRGTTR
jgi:DNA polymerase IV